MIHSFGRRLRVIFGGTTAPDPAVGDATELAAPLQPIVEFVAYAEDCLLSGRIRLAAERLSDMLNDHDEYELIDVMVESLETPEAAEAQAVLVHRDEILLVHAAGPRGSPNRRQRTRPHPVAMQLGPYHVRGYLHALPGSDPLLAIRRRKPMVPITDAWVEFVVGGTHQRRQVGTLVVNREQIDWITTAVDEDIRVPETLDMPVAPGQGPLVKDFTGQIMSDLGEAAGG
ncbi:MAG: hypothetical protein ACSLFN_11450 [Candidatus Limnocylindrales bacterium]